MSRVTKEQLKQYLHKKIEIAKLYDDIWRANPAEIVSDVVVGSRGQPLGICGYGSSKVPAWSKRKVALESECREIDAFVESIDDSLIRMILSLKYINGLSWQQVAFSIGGKNTADSVRVACDRFFAKM